MTVEALAMERSDTFAQAGAKVFMAARNEQSATAAIEQLRAEGLGPGDGEVIWLKLDLSDPREAKKAADAFLEKESRLDVLSTFSLMNSAHREV